MQKHDYEFRGVEIHATRMWEEAHVLRTLDFMQKYNMTALIFHANELLDVLVLPRKLYSEEIMWAYWPVRQDLSLMNKEYIRWVVRQCKKRGIDFVLQCKEIWFYESLLEAHPELGLSTNGAVCPTHLFWPEYMEMRIEELFSEIPDIFGVTVSLGTRESKVSLAANRCKCDRCINVDPKEWYKSIISAMYRPMGWRGKKLIIRDFSYDITNMNAIVDACKEVSDDIIVSLKNTPHDFLIPFPDNPRIGQTNGAPQYIEFDVWGQFFGMGLFPVGVDEDLKERLKKCKVKGAIGAYFRTDLETTRDSSCYNGFSMLNLYAAAMLSQNVNTNLDDIYRIWMTEGITSPLIAGSFSQTPAIPSAPDAWRRFRDFMHASWRVMEKTYYVRGQVFLKNGQVPHSLREAFDMLTKILGRADWEPGIDRLLDRTDENIKCIIEEKAQALKEVKELGAILDLPTIGLPEYMTKDIEEMLDLYCHYVDMIRVVTEAVFRGQKAIETGLQEDIEAVKPCIKALYDMKDTIIKRFEHKYYPHYVNWHFVPTKMSDLAAELKEKLSV